MSTDDVVAALALIFVATFLAGVAGSLLFRSPRRTKPRSRFIAIKVFWNGGIRFGGSRVTHFPTMCSRQRVARLIGVSPFQLYQSKTWVYFRERTGAT
jgi:hypothetical protein